MAVSISTSFVRTLYLVNHQLVADLHRFNEAQALDAFEAFEDESLAKARLKEGEYYLVVKLGAEAVASRAKDGSVYLNRGHIPHIKALKTLEGEIYNYDKNHGKLRLLERERN